MLYTTKQCLCGLPNLGAAKIMETKDAEITDTASIELQENAECKRTRRQHGGSLKDDTRSYCLTEHLCDVWFTFSEGSVKLPAHKLILSMRSEVFEAMFYGPMAESSQVIPMEDIEISTMKMLLRYVYTDDLELDGKNVMGCVYAAKKYALYGMVNMCVQFLESAVTVGTACDIFEQAIFYGETLLQTKCFDFIVENSNGVFKSDGFRSLTSKGLLKVMACDHLASDESVNFNAARTWAENQCKKKNLEMSPENFRACLGEILYQIRFPLMSSETFATQVAHSEMLTKEEMLDLYYYIATKIGSKEKQMVGKFSCKRRTIVINFDGSSLSRAYQGHIILLNTSNPVKLVSIKGDFVQDVSKINATNIGRQDVAFVLAKDKDRVYLTEPLLIRPHSGNVQIVLTMNGEYGLEHVWSSNANISRTVKDTTINVRRVPHGLKSLIFEEA